MVHDAEAVRARKRLYMTATPRLYSPAARKKAEAADAYVATMDDEETYGPELHRLNFADSVERDLLSDYKVAILVMSEEQVAREYQAELADGDGLKGGGCGPRGRLPERAGQARPRGNPVRERPEADA